MKQKVTSQPTHSKQSGFTLIELVIVIIILGILAATAVPKFMDLKGDARGATLDGVKGALESAASLTYAQAAIQGIEKSSTAVATTRNAINAKFGYPDASANGIEKAVELSGEDWFFDYSTTNSAIISVSGAVSTNCNVTYTEATSIARPKITVDATKC